MIFAMNTTIADRCVEVAGLGIELLVGGGAMALILLLMVLAKHDIRRRRSKAAAREHMSIEDFIAAVGAESAYDGLCLAVRAEVARQTELPAGAVLPGDTMEFFESLSSGRLETVCIIEAIEKGMNMQIPDEITQVMPFPHKGFRTAKTTIVDCINGFIECEEFAAFVEQADGSPEND